MASQGASGGVRARLSVVVEKPLFTVLDAGTVVLSGGASYALIGLGIDGAREWVLEVDSERVRVSPEEIAEAVERLPAEFQDTEILRGRGALMHPAIIDLVADAHGHLFVFQYDNEGGTAPAQIYGHGRKPVDVFSSAGTLLFSGWLETRLPIRVAFEDHLYTAGIDPERGLLRVTRFRVVEDAFARAPYTLNQ